MEIKFKRDTTYRQQMFTPESFSHPAKLDSQLFIWICEKYTKAGETILDPMFGSGTAMLACTIGRNVIGVELESKFVRMALDNQVKIQQMPQLGFTMGKAIIFWGDARSILSSKPHPYRDLWRKYRKLDIQSVKSARRKLNLPLAPMTPSLGGVLADHAIFSPPYADAQVPPHTAEGEAKRLKIAKERGVSPDKVSYLDYTKADNNHPTNYLGKQKGESGFEYSDNPANIGNLPYGSVDSVITSPPYSETSGLHHTVTNPEADIERLRAKGYKVNPDSADQKIGQLRYSASKDNIGNLPHGDIDSIITSPPYENQGQGQGQEYHPERMTGSETGLGRGYSDNEKQIGNLKSDSYLSAMLQVYHQCLAVLRPGGLMIVITKDFIRNQKRVDLAGDTIKLCEKLGFTFVERHYRKLPAQSFWRILYKQKYPDAPVIDAEDVLVFKRLQETQPPLEGVG